MANIWDGSGQVLVDGAGNPYASWKLYTYETGTTTNKATYSDAGLTSANTNPVVADANGRMGDVYFIAGRYKLVFKTSADVTIKTIDPFDAHVEMLTASAPVSPTYPFLEYYNTTDGKRYRRNAANSAWIDLGLVDSLGNSATVAQILAGTDTTSFGTPDSIAALWQRGTDIASATTLSLPSTGGRVFNITGTTTINGIGSAVGGTCLKLKFVSALTLTHNGTSFILPGAANITTVAGDTAEFIAEGATDAISSNWRCFDYQRASGSPINITDQVATQANQETGTSVTTVVTPGRQQYHKSAMKGGASFDATGVIAIATSSDYNISSITDNGVGDYSANYTTAFSATTARFTTCSRENNVSVNYYAELDNARARTTTAQGLMAGQNSGGTRNDTNYYEFGTFGDQ